MRVTRVTRMRKVADAGEHITCDVCSMALSPDGDEDFAHEVILIRDQEHCVHIRIRRDLCPQHLDAIWEGLCALLGADAEADGFDPADQL
jgi:hypothetical protein